MMQENENEKKKIGLFGKLKNILFVDDESIDDTKEEPILPDYKNKIEEMKYTKILILLDTKSLEK